MSRRANLPGAAELFRVTGVPPAEPATATDRATERADRASGPATGSAEVAEARTDAAEARADPADDVPPAPVPLRRPASAPAHRPGGDPAGAAGARRGAGPPGAAGGPGASGASGTAPSRRPSGRERHDEKITVYISPEELHDLEHARLVLRREHGVRADRGRLVRVALALALGDLDVRGADSELVRRLREQ